MGGEADKNQEYSKCASHGEKNANLAAAANLRFHGPLLETSAGTQETSHEAGGFISVVLPVSAHL